MPSVNNVPNLTQAQINSLSGSLRPGSTVFNTTTNTLNTTYDNGNTWKNFPKNNYAISSIIGFPQTASPYFDSSQTLAITTQNTWAIAGNFGISRIYSIITVTLSVAGTGYAVNNVVAIGQGGATQSSQRCTIRVDTIGVGGAIATFTVLTNGQYQVSPQAKTFAVQNVTGVGINAQFTVTSVTDVQEKNISDYFNGKLIAGASGVYLIQFNGSIANVTNVNRSHSFSLGINVPGIPPPVSSTFYPSLASIFTSNDFIPISLSQVRTLQQGDTVNLMYCQNNGASVNVYFGPSTFSFRQIE
jgi:hypothetical protein